MKKIFKNLIVLCILFLGGCNTSIENSGQEKKEINQEYHDDIADLENIPNKGQKFSSYNDFVIYMTGLQQIYGNSNFSFFSLEPDLIVNDLWSTFQIRYDDENNELLVNPIIYECFSIFDEDIGSFSERGEMDTPIYSMRFECIFYPCVDTDFVDTDFIIKNVSNKKIQISLDGVFVADITMKNIEQKEFVINYFMNNLKKI